MLASVPEMFWRGRDYSEKFGDPEEIRSRPMQYATVQEALNSNSRTFQLSGGLYVSPSENLHTHTLCLRLQTHRQSCLKAWTSQNLNFRHWPEPQSEGPDSLPKDEQDQTQGQNNVSHTDKLSKRVLYPLLIDPIGNIR